MTAKFLELQSCSPETTAFVKFH